jgi:hypothetical protein
MALPTWQVLPRSFRLLNDAARGLRPLPICMAESKTASMSQTAVTRPSDLFGPTQTQVEHAQGDEDLSFIAST